MNKNSYNTEQIDYVKPYFNCLLTEKIKSLVKEIIPTIIFPEYLFEFLFKSLLYQGTRIYLKMRLENGPKALLFLILSSSYLKCSAKTRIR